MEVFAAAGVDGTGELFLAGGCGRKFRVGVLDDGLYAAQGAVGEFTLHFAGQAFRR